MPSQAERMNEERTTKKPKVAAKKKTMTDVQSEMSAKNEKNKPSAPAKAAEPAAKKQTFKEAFAAARTDNIKNGTKKNFTWNGKEYNTKVKEEVAAKPKAAIKESPKPAPKKKKERPYSRFMY